MNAINRLISQLCPDGVESLELGEVCTDFIVPMRDRPPVFDGDIPWCRIEDIQRDLIHGSLSGLMVSKKVIADMNLKVMPTGTVIASCSASLGRYAITTTPLITNQTFIGLVCGEKLLNKYLLHLLPLKTPELVASSNSGTIPYISRAKFEKLRIPVPPIEIQHEIAKILDTFITLEAELEAELELRIRQYDFYRDSLLGFGNQRLKWIEFGAVATIVRGASPRPIQKFITDSEDGIPWIKIGDTIAGEKYVTSTKQKITYEGARNSRYVEPGDFLLSNSMSFGRPYISKIQGCIHDGWLVISNFEENLNADYLYHVLQSHAMQMEFARRASNGTVSNLNADIVKSVLVPLPPLAEQAKIAELLDNFEMLVTDPEKGLPAEISARRQQYEYYRSKLLTFSELEVA